ncbi:uncharacterized mitochondrial protein AtMg00810-like [Lycium barbarum]|uniref:uncharacterized mitochondrial protein AtMg00810-like n=1 Tax=Lycium barbarum TaxID=112863 RepID=UPI00293F3F2F|nr:uncharacterized mitochondrial protein AtMg00810-like [Lycium barbarum]
MSMMGELKFFLGLQIHQTDSGIFICQAKYAKELVQKFGMSDSKAMGTPMSPTCTPDKDETGKPVDETKYRGMIGSLLYLTARRPDIMFSVSGVLDFKLLQSNLILLLSSILLDTFMEQLTMVYGILTPMILHLKVFQMHTLQVIKIIEKVPVVLASF